MPRSTLLLIVLALSITSCVSVADLPKPANVYGPIPQGTRLVAIRVAPIKPDRLKNVGGLSDPGQFLGRYFKDALALKQPDWKVRILDGPPAATKSDIVISAEILGINGGNAGLRFWIGFSAGAAESTVLVSVSDKSGKELAQATIMERTMCPIGACVDSNDDIIQRTLLELAKEMAAFVANPAEYKKEK